MSFSRLLRDSVEILGCGSEKDKKAKGKDVSEIKVLRGGGIIPNNNIDLCSHWKWKGNVESF